MGVGQWAEDMSMSLERPWEGLATEYTSHRHTWSNADTERDGRPQIPVIYSIGGLHFDVSCM